jgi:hypothetical protein
MEHLTYRKLIRTIALASVLILISACSKVAENPTALAETLIQGDVTPATYAVAARDTLAHATGLMNREASPESAVDADIGKMKSLLALSEQRKLDEKHKYDVALTSSIGALYAQKSKINKNAPRTALEFIEQAFHYMDKAVGMAPQNLDARVRRGLVSATLPGFLGKAEVAQKDLRYVRDNAEFGKLPPNLQASIKRALADVDAELAAEHAP